RSRARRWAAARPIPRSEAPPVTIAVGVSGKSLAGYGGSAMITCPSLFGGGPRSGGPAGLGDDAVGGGRLESGQHLPGVRRRSAPPPPGEIGRAHVRTPVT